MSAVTAYLAKKRWNPSNKKNVEEVWKREEAEREEQKRIQELKREYEEERNKEALEELQVKAGVKKTSTKMGWMYDPGPNSETGNKNAIHELDKQEREAFLLGEKSFNQLVAEPKVDISKKSAVATSSTAHQSQPVLSQSEVLVRMHEDPLTFIKQKQQERKSGSKSTSSGDRDKTKMKKSKKSKSSKRKHKSRSRSSSSSSSSSSESDDERLDRKSSQRDSSRRRDRSQSRRSRSRHDDTSYVRPTHRDEEDRIMAEQIPTGSTRQDGRRGIDDPQICMKTGRVDNVDRDSMHSRQQSRHRSPDRNLLENNSASSRRGNRDYRGSSSARRRSRSRERR